MSITIALVGTGGIANAHATAAANIPDAEITACCDLVREKADAFASKYGIPKVYDSMADMLNNQTFDLVILATFPANHLAEIQQAVELGARGILCEKALAMNGEEADEIHRIARENDVFLVEGLMYRHHPQIQKARQLIDEGVIGDLCVMQAQFCSYAEPDPNNWRHVKALGGGSMAAKGVYLIDAFNFFAAHTLQSVFSRETIHAESGVEIGVNATLFYADNVVGQFNSNHYACWREDIKLVGRKGTIIIPHAIVTRAQPRHIEVQLGGAYEDEPRENHRYEFDPANSYQLQLKRIVHCMKTGDRPIVPLEDSVYNLHTTSALLASSERGQVVDFTYERSTP